MTILYQNEIRESLGNRALSVLAELFEVTRDSIEGIGSERFRADHIEDMDLLDKLSEKTLLTDRWHESHLYRLKLYALPLVDHSRSKEILAQGNEILRYLQNRYKISLKEDIPVNEVSYDLQKAYGEIAEAFLYMRDGHGWFCGCTNPFPFGDDFPSGRSAKIQTCETVLRYESLDDIINQYYEWHFINPGKIVDKWDISNEKLSAHLGQKLYEGSGNSMPAWYEQLDDNKKALLIEVVRTLGINLSALPSTGIRTLIEMVMVEKIGNEGTFANKLDRFANEDHISKKHSDLLSKVIDVGNASAHRGHFPSTAELSACLDVLNHLLEQIYVLNPKVDKVSESTPKREAGKAKKG